MSRLCQFYVSGWGERLFDTYTQAWEFRESLGVERKMHPINHTWIDREPRYV